MEEKKIEETVNQLTKIKKDRKKQKQKMPKEVSQIIFKKIFNQLLAAICIMLYFVILNLAYVNMREERLIGDIKVFAGAFLVVGIVMLEKAYRKEIGKYVVIGIELLVLSLHTLSIMHIITLLEYDFRLYLLTSSYIFSIYYVLKSIVIYVRERRIYLRGLSDISENIKKEEPTKKEATKKVIKEEPEDKTKEEKEKTTAVSKDKTVKKEGKKTSTKKSQAKGKATTKKGEKETDMKKKNVSSEKGKIETKKIVSSKGEGKIETKKTESAKKEEKVATKKKVSSKEQKPTKGNAKTKKEEEKKTTRNTTSSQKANKKGTSKKTKTQKQKEEEVNEND